MLREKKGSLIYMAIPYITSEAENIFITFLKDTSTLNLLRIIKHASRDTSMLLNKLE